MRIQRSGFALNSKKISKLEIRGGDAQVPEGKSALAGRGVGRTSLGCRTLEKRVGKRETLWLTKLCSLERRVQKGHLEPRKHTELVSESCQKTSAVSKIIKNEANSLFNLTLIGSFPT